MTGVQTCALPICKHDSGDSQFVLEPGGEGLIRWMPKPKMCVSVQGKKFSIGAPLELQPCEAHGMAAPDGLHEAFYFGLYAPQLHMPCFSASSCAFSPCAWL